MRALLWITVVLNWYGDILLLNPGLAVIKYVLTAISLCISVTAKEWNYCICLQAEGSWFVDQCATMNACSDMYNILGAALGTILLSLSAVR